ncbi:anaphase-promoting complex subunit cut9 [Gigaspora margarita]|uniref:Anaphase-promoting complex subunit cut9 n=1 Tax=Gigaspora margarita TaxID=4874 RepID=A0A8H3XN02_GIGMA|nr:anaphase-promoting complex subunit cut9 [Gigaspora margarita]
MNYILNVDSKNAFKSRLTCLPIHILCLHELCEKNKLFLLAHELVEHSSDKGCYNLLIGQNGETRSEASTMYSHCGPTWIGFRHILAIESEHDQAITDYSTTADYIQAKNLLSSE